MTYFSRTRRTAVEALRLRAWALRRLLEGADEVTPAASPHAWRTFLRWERCALLLQEALGERTAQIPADCASELQVAAMHESMWLLSARAQLRTVRGIAAANGMDVMVLKSTAEAARGRNVQVTDVDILSTPTGTSKLKQLLDEAGFLPGPRGGASHSGVRTVPGAVEIDVHRVVSGFDSPASVPWHTARPISGMEPLLALAPQDHAWTVLCQAIRHHPDRRTRIRDLYMVRTALSECTLDEQAVLEERVQTDTHRAELIEMLRQATEVSRRDPRTEKRLRRLYLLYAREWGESTNPTLGILWRMVVEGVAGGAFPEWKRKQRWREYAGLPRWSVRRLLVSLPLALWAALLGRLASIDEFIMER